MCITGSGAGKRAGATSEPVRRRSNYEWSDDQAGRQRPANTDVDEGIRMHATTNYVKKQRQEPNVATSCARGGGVPAQQQGRGGTGQAKSWKPQQGDDRKEKLEAAPRLHDQIQNTPVKGRPGEGQSPVNIPGPIHQGTLTAGVQCGVTCVP